MVTNLNTCYEGAGHLPGITNCFGNTLGLGTSKTLYRDLYGVIWYGVIDVDTFKARVPVFYLHTLGCANLTSKPDARVRSTRGRCNGQANGDSPQ